MTRWTVYLLIDPRDGEIRYVGASKQWKVRVRAHINESYGGKKVRYAPTNVKKAAWIQELLKLGLKPIGEPLLSFKSPRVAAQSEEDWIRRLRLAGCQLFNWNHRYWEYEKKGA